MVETTEADWQALFDALPEGMRLRFEEMLRRTIKRSLSDATFVVPEVVRASVRSQAVGVWRRERMQGATKSAKKRTGYDQLKGNAAFRRLERKLLDDFIKKRGSNYLPSERQVKRMSLPELCETVRRLQIDLVGTPFDSAAHELLRDACARCAAVEVMREELPARMLEIARTQDLSPYVSSVDSMRYDGGKHQGFYVGDLFSTEAVVGRVEAAGLVEGMLGRTAHGTSLAEHAKGRIVDELYSSRDALPHAQGVIESLIELCEDSCEIVYHRRLVPLRCAAGGFRIPESVRPGDALIVFSRRSVHAVADELAAAGLKASMVYGALPHDVRHEEARRFDVGETDVVVATDAIGMGMNLPIRRVVFVEQEKYDGRTLRPLLAEEVQQIAGRAGRFGRYEEGFYQSTRAKGRIERLAGEAVPPIMSIPVGIPEDIALVRDASLGESLRQWMAIEQPEPFYRMDVARELSLVGESEALVDAAHLTQADVKGKILRLATLPFDERDRRLKAAWKAMATAELVGEGASAELPIPAAPNGTQSLATLEADYAYCDLLYSYGRSFGHDESLELLCALRDQISHAIMALLAEGRS